MLSDLLLCQYGVLSDTMSSTVTWVVQAWGKVSKEVIINSFDVCRITTNKAAKIPCLREEHGGADTEESTGMVILW